MLFRRFIAALKTICLTPEEKRAHHPLGFVIKREDERLILTMDEQQFFSSAAKIQLLPHERVAIKESLFKKATKTSSWSIRIKGWSSVMAAVLIVTITGTSMSYAAEYAVPGDVLYPIKVRVNEELKSRMMASADERAEWEVQRAGRRLDEAGVLSTRGDVDVKTMASLESSFQKHAAVVEAHMVTLQHEQKSDEVEALSAKFNTALKQKSQEIKESMKTASADPLLRRVHSTRVTMKVAELESMEARTEALEENAERFNKRAVPNMGLTMQSDTESDEIMNDGADDGRMADTTETMATKNVASFAAMSATLSAEEDDDLQIETEARMSMARKQMKSVDAASPQEPVQQTRNLLERATRELDVGNFPRANEAATEALERMKAMKQQLKREKEVLRPAASKLEEQLLEHQNVFSSSVSVREKVDPSIDDLRELQ